MVSFELSGVKVKEGSMCDVSWRVFVTYCRWLVIACVIVLMTCRHCDIVCILNSVHYMYSCYNILSFYYMCSYIPIMIVCLSNICTIIKLCLC